MTPWERYQADLERNDFAYDAAQEVAVRRLQHVYEQLVASGRDSENGWKSLWSRLSGKGKKAVRGLYLWGGVGRGKTYLVDAFFDSLPFADKRRLHFHRFMQAVHKDLGVLREQRDPLRILGNRLAQEMRVLCFDEFFVSDIADAMILGGLFEALFDSGVTLIATSNVPPDDLYRDGLQRERFLPAIALLKRYTETLNVDGGVDHRLRSLEQGDVYYVSADRADEAAILERFGRFFHGGPRRGLTLELEGRPVPVRAQGDGVVWFDFTAICDGPRGQADYIEVARRFHTVLVSDVPVLTADFEDQARRFISMVDEFYDRCVKLLMLAEAPPPHLYRGRRLGFEFQRTLSRLEEMRSRDYLARPHRP